MSFPFFETNLEVNLSTKFLLKMRMDMKQEMSFYKDEGMTLRDKKIANWSGLMTSY